MADIIIKQIRDSAAEFPQVWQLREEILRQPLGLSLKDEDLSDDKPDTIFIALHNDKVIGCVMMHPVDADTIKLRQMAVHTDWQGKGIGKMLVAAAEQFSWRKNYIQVVMHARDHAIGFYENSGYKVCSAFFTEVKIPHVKMEKTNPFL